MSKTTKLLMAGGLLTLALMVLVGNAAAKETMFKCEGTGACTFAATSGVTSFSIIGGDTVKCEASSGSGDVINLNAERESTTSTVQLLYTGCKEQNTIFHFACSNTATSGNITTNVMTMHDIALPGTSTEAGGLLTNAGVTFTCAGGFASTQITGSLIGHIEEPCGHTGTTLSILYTESSDGEQVNVAYTGSTFDLEGKTSHTGGGSYATAAQAGTVVYHFNQSFVVTC